MLFLDHRRGGAAFAVVASRTASSCSPRTPHCSARALCGQQSRRRNLHSSSHHSVAMPESRRQESVVADLPRRHADTAVRRQALPHGGRQAYPRVAGRVRHRRQPRCARLLLAPLYHITAAIDSLVARIFFQPVEESLRVLFPPLLPSTHASTPSAPCACCTRYSPCSPLPRFSCSARPSSPSRSRSSHTHTGRRAVRACSPRGCSASPCSSRTARSR